MSNRNPDGQVFDRIREKIHAKVNNLLVRRLRRVAKGHTGKIINLPIKVSKYVSGWPSDTTYTLAAIRLNPNGDMEGWGESQSIYAESSSSPSKGNYEVMKEWKFDGTWESIKERIVAAVECAIVLQKQKETGENNDR